MAKKKILQNINTVLSKHYYNLNSNAAYGNLKQLYEKVEGKYTKKQVKEWLERQLSHSLHRGIKRKFKRRPMYTTKPYNNFQIDLADMSSLSDANENYKYFLLAVDVFSRKIFVRPLKSKKGKEVSEAMNDILLSLNKKPKLICSDRGTEFLSKEFKHVLDTHNIHLFHTQNYDKKAAIAERAIRTIKSKIYKYLTANNTRSWLKALEKIVKNYNNTVHGSIEEKPNNVNDTNVERIFHNSWNKKLTQQRRQYDKTLKPGDYVRLVNLNRSFAKGFLPQWTDEMFIIDKIITQKPATFAVKDLNDEQVKGGFYASELQRVGAPDDSTVYRIEKVLKRKNNMLYVKWLGFSSEHNSWIPSKSFKTGEKL